MRKLMMLAAMLAVVLAVALPAIAQEVQAPTETFVSGQNQNTGGAVTAGGNNSNTCTAQENFNNSGGVLNQQSLQQYDSTLGTGSVFLGPSFANTPSQVVPCAQTVQQAASSSSGT
jgi:hypothetical protein